MQDQHLYAAHLRSVEQRLRQELAAANEQLRQLRQDLEVVNGLRVHEGCGGTLRVTNLACDRCYGKQLASPSQRKRNETKARQSKIIQFAAHPYFGPNPMSLHTARFTTLY